MADPYDLDDPEYQRIALELLAQPRDVLESFVSALSNEGPMSAQALARETIQMRKEFEHHARTCLLASGEKPDECMASAHWMAKNAQETTFRWWALMRAAIRWNMVQVPAMRYVVR